MTRRQSKEKDEWLAILNNHIEHQINNGGLSVSELADLMFCSTRQLQRRLKEYTGQTPADYLNSIRLNKSYQYLTQGTYPTVSATARALGFRDTVYFSRKFREHFGILPSEV